MGIIWYGLVFWLGINVGFLVDRILVSKLKTYSGEMIVTEDENKKLYSLELYETIEDLDQRSEITFKVVSPDRD